jgi:hypothetical protein
MYAERKQATVTTDALGAGTGYIEASTGRVLAVHYRKPGSGGYENGVAIKVSTETTGQTIWEETLAANASKDVYPCRTLHTSAGVEIADAYVHPLIVNERLKVEITSGGDTKAGTVYAMIG